MAGEPQPATAAAVIDPSEYDLGNTNLDMRQPSGIPEPPPQPRAENGQFAAAPETPAAPPASTHPGYLVEFAKEFGFTDEEITSLSTEQLGRSVGILRKRDRERMSQLSAEYQVHNPRQPVAPPAPVVPPPEPEIDLGIDESQYGPGMIEAMKKVRRDSIKENQQLKEQLAAIQAQQQEQLQTASANHLDAAFDALGDGYEHVFGKGLGLEIEQDDPLSIQRRVEIIKAIAARDRINPYKISPKALAAKIKSIADPLYKIQPPAPPKPAAPADPYANGGLPTPTNGKGASRFTPEQWEQAGLSTPTARKGSSEPKGEELAKANLAKRQRELGIAGSTPTQSELDGFLP